MEKKFKEIVKDINEEIFNISKKNPWWFFTKCVYFYDPDYNPKIRPFPDYAYIRFWWDVFQHEQYILVLKSRQITATWSFIAFVLYEALFNPGRYCILQSSKEEKAGWGGKKSASDIASLLSRVEFIYKNLPPIFHKKVKMERTYRPSMIVLKHQSGEESFIRAISSKETDFRQFPKGCIIIADEFAFQPEAHESFVASQPIIGDTGKYIAITSANNNPFLRQLLYGNEITDDYPEYLDKYPRKINTDEELIQWFRLEIPTKYLNPIPYVVYWRNDRGFAVILTSKKAIPLSNIDEKIEKDKKVLSQIEFNREYLLDLNVNVGQARIYTTFNPDFHIAKNELRPEYDIPILRGWDFGRRHPCVIFAQKITKENTDYPYGTLLILEEVLGRDISLVDFLNYILAFSEEKFSGFSFQDFCDPISINQRSDKAEYSTLQYLLNKGISPVFQKFPITTGVNIIDALLTHKIGRKYPFILISPKCKNLIQGFQGGFRLAKDGQLPLKDGYFEHFHDALRYIAVMNYTFEEIFYLSKKEPKIIQKVTLDEYDKFIQEYVENKMKPQNKKIRTYNL